MAKTADSLVEKLSKLIIEKGYLDKKPGEIRDLYLGKYKDTSLTVQKVTAVLKTLKAGKTETSPTEESASKKDTSKSSKKETNSSLIRSEIPQPSVPSFTRKLC